MMKPMELNATAKLHQWWKPKASNLLGILYLVMFITLLPFSKALILFFPSVLTILGIGSFGHFINDLYDREVDLKANKLNRLATLSTFKRNSLLLAALFIALAPWLILPFDTFSILLLLFEFCCLLAYAIPPLRLKEKKIGAVLADGAYAYAIPSLLAAYTFFLAGRTSMDILFISFLFSWQWLYGVRHYLNHLAIDRINDVHTGIATLATIKGNKYIHQLISRFLLPLEILLFILFQVQVIKYTKNLPLCVLLLFVCFYFVQAVQFILRRNRLFNYRFSTTTLDLFYQDGWVYVPLFFLVFTDWSYLILVLLHWLLFRPFLFSRKELKRMYLNTVYHLYYNRVTYYLFYPLIFLKRRFFPGHKSPEQVALEQQTVKAYRKRYDKKHVAHSVNIAIVNINQAKYTETFINDLIPQLKYNVYYLFGGALPIYDDRGDYFLSRYSVWRALLSFLETCFHLGPDYFLKQSISNYLQTKKIQLVLAEFGSVGVRMSPITQAIGIPLVVNFHGYDVYNTHELEQYEKGYFHLFREATKIIAVSEHMIQRLEDLGAPKQKLFHLPAFINIDLFPYCDHSSLPPKFIAVGRFSETKSPHLTILAFHQVVQKIPEATLTLIGKGGGGELYEACRILVKSLGIEKAVIFKGALPHDLVAAEMQKARIFVQHSVTTPENGDREGKPVAIMEAMACGLPVIATSHSGIVELIEHEVNGLLIQEYDIDAMYEAMLLLAYNDKLVKQLGKEAGRSIRENPLISRHVEILEELIDDCMK